MNPIWASDRVRLPGGQEVDVLSANDSTALVLLDGKPKAIALSDLQLLQSAEQRNDLVCFKSGDRVKGLDKDGNAIEGIVAGTGFRVVKLLGGQYIILATCTEVGVGAPSEAEASPTVTAQTVSQERLDEVAVLNSAQLLTENKAELFGQDGALWVVVRTTYQHGHACEVIACECVPLDEWFGSCYSYSSLPRDDAGATQIAGHVVRWTDEDWVLTGRSLILQPEGAPKRKPQPRKGKPTQLSLFDSGEVA